MCKIERYWPARRLLAGTMRTRNNFVMLSFTWCFSVWMFVSLWLSLLVLEVQGRCANNCNGNGVCDKYSRCICHRGYMGGDCSLRTCPVAPAWADIPYGTDLAHAEIECSNKGVCNRATGLCTCQEGFHGAACEHMSCSANCNGYGTCYSMLNYAKRTQNVNSQTFLYESIWDADMIAGCHCDYRHSGFDCSLKECPDGDDPLTTGQVNEVQLVTCISDGVGSFILSYQGYKSKAILADYKADMVRDAILQIPILTDVQVSFSIPTSVACAKSVNVISIEFTQQFGSLPPLNSIPDAQIIDTKGSVNVYADGLSSITDGNGKTFTSVKGTKESDSCAHRGICSKADGLCYCYSTNGDTYGSSNGYGAAGTRGDCGFIVSGSTVASCPGDTPCSGHGVCDLTTGVFRCDCEANWFGGDCSLRKCPEGRSWFDYPRSDNVAHKTWAECSNMGLCDTSIGSCSCATGFGGEACQYMLCGGGIATQCSGNGICMNMKQLALWAENNGDATSYTYGEDPNKASTWDAALVHGCLCDEGFEGYDCSLMSCPRGKDPGMQSSLGVGPQVDEVQILRCEAVAGTFTLSFRQQVTSDLSSDITALQLADGLRNLSTIEDIQVTYIRLADDYRSIDTTQNFANLTACDKYGKTFIKIVFTHNAGNLPALIVDTSKLEKNVGELGGRIFVSTDGAYADTGVVTQDTDLSYEGTLVQSVAGTTENLVCNGRGICDHASGKCNCFDGYSSSDGSGLIGNTGDCGYRVITGPKGEL